MCDIEPEVRIALHLISEDICLCCQKGKNKKKGVVRPRRCPHTCRGMPSYLKKNKGPPQVSHVKVWYAKHLSRRNVALRTYMHRQLCRHEKRTALCYSMLQQAEHLSYVRHGQVMETWARTRFFHKNNTPRISRRQHCAMVPGLAAFEATESTLACNI